MNASAYPTVDWQAFKAALGEVPSIDNPKLRRAKSRDFFWYSPILARELDHCLADLVVMPRDQDDLVAVIRLAVEWRVPITLRGRGSGNYGQAVPLEGGVVIEMTRLNGVLEIGPDFVRVEAGCNLGNLDEALRVEGRELAIFSSTMRIATVGGFVGGGSGGVGSIEHGMLRDGGNLIAVKALSVEAEPVEHEFTGDDVNLLHHAWGLNGIMTEVTLKTAPERDWINCIASFASYRAAFDAGTGLGERTDLGRRLGCTVDAGFVPYIKPLADHIEAGRHLLLALVDRADVDGLQALVTAHDGRLELSHDDREMAARGLPQVLELSFNHTTLQVLNVDDSVTYLQARVPAPIDPDRVDRLREVLGGEVLMHHEFVRIDGDLVAIDLPVVFYTTDQRLYEIIDIYEAHGCPVSDPHTFIIEQGGMRNANVSQLALKKRMDPMGLLNPGKSVAWDRVKHMTPEAIEAVRPEDPVGPGTVEPSLGRTPG